MDGNALHPRPSTSSATAPSSASLMPLLPPFWTRRQAPSLRVYSRPGLLLLNFHLHLRTSESCCCGASGSLCRSLPLSAAADIARTSSGIISLHAPVPVCCTPEVPHLSVLPLVSAVKLVLLLQQTSWCGTSPCRQDDRRIEVIANGLPFWGGVQVAVDTTLVSPLAAAGEPRRESRRTAGAALRYARRAKERTYPELCNSGRCRLVVLGIETGGRWSPEAVTFLRLIARSRARSAPPPLQSACISAYVFGWSALLAFAAARAFATSLSPCRFPGQPMSTEILRSSATFSPNHRLLLLLPAACPDMPT